MFLANKAVCLCHLAGPARYHPVISSILRLALLCHLLARTLMPMMALYDIINLSDVFSVIIGFLVLFDFSPPAVIAWCDVMVLH